MADMKLSDGEKLMLLMLCEIYDHLQVKGETDTKFIRDAILHGQLWGLKERHIGIYHGYEADPGTVSDVKQVMDMWRYIETSYARLAPQDKARVEKEAKPFGENPKFPGFGDGEGLGIARFIIEHLGYFDHFKGRDLDAHLPMRDAYHRMLAVFEPLRSSLGGRDLNADQLIQILMKPFTPRTEEQWGTPTETLAQG